MLSNSATAQYNSQRPLNLRDAMDKVAMRDSDQRSKRPCATTKLSLNGTSKALGPTGPETHSQHARKYHDKVAKTLLLRNGSSQAP